MRSISPKKETSPLLALCARVEDDPKAVLADPLWRKLRAKDPDVLSTTPPQFRLALLRHHFKRHRTRPWALAELNDEGTWPLWNSEPAWELRGEDAVHPDESEDSICSSSKPLAGGWSFCFCAKRAEVEFELEGVEWSRADDSGMDDSGFPMVRIDHLLVALFTSPGKSLADALPDYCIEPSISPCGGNDPAYAGIKLSSPHGDLDATLCGDDYFGNENTVMNWQGDEALIDALVHKDGRFLRRPAKGELPRPLFLEPPEIDSTDEPEGQFTCSWRTDYYVPVSVGPVAERTWSYEKHQLRVRSGIKGHSADELVEYAWRFRTMRDLEGMIAGAATTKEAHKIFLPIYNEVLFADSPAKRPRRVKAYHKKGA